MLTVGSLFAGIGGFDLGFERAGMRTLWQVEQSEFCRRVLERHFPDAERFEDVRDVGAAELAPVDLICGGFPCQDISLAGRGAGIEGERSGLWSEYARIVGELRPRYVVVENVPALLARGLGRVLGDLAALGYDAEWDCLPASAFGAPHQRDRLWLVAYPNSDRIRVEPERDQREGWPVRAAERRNAVASYDGPEEPVADAEREGLEGRGRGSVRQGPATGSGTRAGAELADAHGTSGDGSGCSGEAVRGPEAIERPGRRSGLRGAVQDPDSSALQPWRVGGRVAQAGGPEWWAVEPPVGRVAHGVPDRLDQLSALGNALVHQIAEGIGRRIIEWEGGLA